mmetsp:Transcript_4873/g.8489  ORF Transcript_4873/g.8489 Transcript_4873/m.8489 type:complete len:222 (+) Transcript_4873:113-778(+)
MIEACIGMMQDVFTYTESVFEFASYGNSVLFVDKHVSIEDSPITPQHSNVTPVNVCQNEEEFFYGDFSDSQKNSLLRQMVNLLEKLCAQNDEFLVIPDKHSSCSMFYSQAKQNVALETYIQRFFTYLDVSPAAYIAAFIYLGRVQKCNPQLSINSYNVHRLFMAAMTLGIKYTEDLAYSNQVIAKVGGVPSSREVSQLEKHMLATLNFNLYIENQLFQLEL